MLTHRCRSENSLTSSLRVLQGRNVFMRDMEPFIKWLDEAEEEDED